MNHPPESLYQSTSIHNPLANSIIVLCQSVGSEKVSDSCPLYSFDDYWGWTSNIKGCYLFVLLLPVYVLCLFSYRISRTVKLACHSFISWVLIENTKLPGQRQGQVITLGNSSSQVASSLSPSYRVVRWRGLAETCTCSKVYYRKGTQSLGKLNLL